MIGEQLHIHTLRDYDNNNDNDADAADDGDEEADLALPDERQRVKPPQRR